MTRSIEYEYDILVRWLLKIFFNAQRSYKRNTQWYEENIDYILNGGQVTRGDVSLFMALTKTPDFLPREISKILNPKEIEMYFEVPFMTKINLKDKDKEKRVELDGSSGTCLLRIGSLLFVVILWTEIENRNKIKEIISSKFPYSLLSRDASNIEIEVATNALTINNPQTILSYEENQSFVHKFTEKYK